MEVDNGIANLFQSCRLYLYIRTFIFFSCADNFSWMLQVYKIWCESTRIVKNRNVVMYLLKVDIGVTFTYALFTEPRVQVYCENNKLCIPSNKLDLLQQFWCMAMTV